MTILQFMCAKLSRQQLVRSLFSLGFSLSTLVLALALSWLVFASLHFFYGFWHDHAGIGEAIENYAPENHYKHGFADTTRAQRMAIFAQINRAIHQNGEGLAEIRYPVSGGQFQTLLRPPEVVHLQDVANVITFLKPVIIGNALLWLILVLVFKRNNNLNITWRSQGLTLIVIVTITLMILFLFGAENVFNQLHIWVFPDDHPWFFYYQESLMSTMMYAPVLFAWIAAELALLGLIFFCLLLVLVLRFQKVK